MKLLYNNLADFPAPSENGSSISGGAVVGIVAAVVIVIILLFGILWWKGCFGKKSSLENGNKPVDCNDKKKRCKLTMLSYF